MDKARGFIWKLLLLRSVSVKVSASLGTLNAFDQSASLGRHHTGGSGISLR